ncbi:MAG: hypothetical protein JSW34_01625 [Candidatus Zixiibacteriota bacterium]|nr:MAG: hypothetical protein JSW34_01625 [candidate division Zixibacteria bacterium]
MVAAKVLRWFVSRLTEPDETEKDQKDWLSVTITLESQMGVPADLKGHPEKMTDKVADNLAWWMDDDEGEVDGTADHDVLLESIASRNVGQEGDKPADLVADRTLTEGMVFLQFIPKSDLSEFDKTWNRLKSAEGIPNVEKLAALGKSRWCDFTSSARNMSASLYQQLLGDKEVSGNETK